MAVSDDQLIELRRVAAAIWSEPRAGAVVVWAEYGIALQRFEFPDVLAALVELGQRTERFPSLARLIATTRDVIERRGKATPAITQPPAPTPSPAECVVQFDESAREWREQRLAELDAVVRAYAKAGIPLSAEDVAGRRSAIETEGPFVQKARSLLLDGMPPAEATRELLRALHTVPRPLPSERRYSNE